MDVRKCCVGNCPSTNRTHRLFSIPKDDNLRQLWLSFLIPTNIELSGLSKHQLVTKRVCQNHFDRHQFDNFGNRLPHGYPCLFSDKEIAFGIPLSSTVGDHLSDHNYFLLSAPDSHIVVASTSGIEVGDDHSYHLPIDAESVIEKGSIQGCRPILTEPMDIESSEQVLQTPIVDKTKGCRPILTEPMDIESSEQVLQTPIVDKTKGCRPIPTEPMDIESSEQVLQTPIVDRTKGTSRSSRENVSKTLTTKLDLKRAKNAQCTGFVKKIKKQTLAMKNKTFSQRLAGAKTLHQDRSFLLSFGKLNKHAQNFIMMQLKSVDKKKKGVRFTEDEKLLALTLMKESPKGYRLLQKIFNLPTKRTLNRLAEKITFSVGINQNLFQLIEKRTTKWDEKKKICSIVFDEVALTPNVTYVESKDEIRGFKDLGNQRSFDYCDHALVFMLRGVCSNWKQPICYYFCEGTISAAELKRILQEIVAKVSETGLIPVALVCDQGTTFRSGLKMIRKDTEQRRNLKGERNDGTIEVSGQMLNVVFDPPHLLKGLRNNFLTKNLVFNGSIATWEDILTIYRADCQLGHTRMNKKLTDHHVIPSKIKKMKVSVAAQVLSEQTSAMLKYTSLFDTTVGGEKVSSSMKTTGEAVEFMDKLFDSVNGSRSSAKKGKLRGPVKPGSKHFEFWREAIKTLKNMRFVDSASKRAKDNKTQYYVRVPSLDGWVTTLESFERIAKLLFTVYAIQYFYPRLINQDPLENFFGRIRAINYRNVNPDSNTFVNAFKSLLISNVMGPHSIYSNCEDDGGETIIDFYNLLKESGHNDKDKENIPPSNISVTYEKTLDHNQGFAITATNERVRVHASAYTAGYICRKLCKRFNCKDCQKTFIAEVKENYHQWITHREYRQLKNNNLCYPSKRFLILYREITNKIHLCLNKNAPMQGIGKYIKQEILKSYEMDWLGCSNHNIRDYYITLILRLHIHNWCNIINKILKGDLEQKYVMQMNAPQIKAYNKYKTYRLRNKNK